MKTKRQIKKIVVHVSDSDDSLDFGFRDVNEWHKQRGFLSPSGIHCGYHYIIRRNGTVEVGRPLEEAGAHVQGHNAKSIGICWIGRNHISPEQKKSLMTLIRDTAKQFNLDLVDDVFGHYELNPGKTCPNLDMVKLRAELVFK